MNTESRDQRGVSFNGELGTAKFIPDISDQATRPDHLGGLFSKGVGHIESPLKLEFSNSSLVEYRRPTRGPFLDIELRQQTAETRRIGSCIRCKMQRIRWSDMFTKAIKARNTTKIRLIRISEGLSTKVFEILIGDILSGRGLDNAVSAADYVKHCWAFPSAFTLVDPGLTEAAFARYVPRIIGHILLRFAGPSGGMLRMTYRLACDVLEDPSTPKESAQLLGVVLRTWTSIRLLTLPAFVVDDKEPESRQMKDLIPAPPATLREELMGRLQNMMKGNRKENWLVVYLTTFVLLHNTALLTACNDDTVFNHKSETPVPEFDVSETYHGEAADPWLYPFTSANSRGLFPVTDNFQEQTLRRVAGLDEKQAQVIRHCAKLADVHEHDWEKLDVHDRPNSYFFISQIFEVSWKPRFAKYG
ncbi:hypothetical protein PCL_00038 [Purpureocillium lilacinum]|uniref:Uncharacterized protein n=1 Tax=Purpureocillium lilacinum TaxID=33203 RepID=A0A2U3DP67_PURLI|nr:hypothetical protein PCL_02565 [Purpureocillium lilacinum]PWI64043.1 hypothetical protein PCL_00038 [Purpureocillium lilacinum]